MRRFIIDIFFLALGGLIGVVWGVHHPSQAENIADQEHIQSLRVQVAVDQEKIKLLQQFGGTSAATTQEIDDTQKKLDEANQELSAAATQPS
ncbi:MAG TPA: hypothetical protein VL992_17885 [Tepidisphaeraceae bacterium]|nr:hypothetical protein [Tepidisphaeraceae bacterium]